jgi:FixJ family two-component response regulator
MQTQKDFSENQAMHGIAVALLSEDREQSAILQNRLESTHVARIVFSNVGFPLSATDPVVRQMQAQRAEVVLVDVNSEDPQRAIRTIELIRATTSDIAIFAIGEMRNPMAIVGSMRAGAGEFIDRNTGTEGLLEAFTRFSAARSKSRSTGKARVFTVINAKGGSGATTLAVNTAVALQQHGQTILVDFSPIGHAALHLNARPTFSVMDALQPGGQSVQIESDDVSLPFVRGVVLREHARELNEVRITLVGGERVLCGRRRDRGRQKHGGKHDSAHDQSPW